MRSKRNISIIFLLLTTSAFCQVENLKWQKANISFQKSDNFRHRNYSFESDNVGEFVKKSFINAYWFFISDVDGDNCSFSPTCSSFFIDGLDETNVFQATLMLSDRLVRDSNPFKSKEYPKRKSGYYYDPAYNYTLNREKINYLPSTFIADDE